MLRSAKERLYAMDVADIQRNSGIRIEEDLLRKIGAAVDFTRIYDLVEDPLPTVQGPELCNHQP